MKKLDESLMSEGIRQDPRQAALVPAQYYSHTLAEFVTQFREFIHTSRQEGRRVSVFVDGASKRSSAGKNSDIDASFQEILAELGIACDWIDLSRTLGLPPPEIHASHTCVDKVRAILRDHGGPVIIALGSGSLTDLVKHALYLEHQAAPFIVIPTALTVTAFTSAFSVIDFHGAKRTLISREVSATFWLKPYLECAPSRMSRAGYGDLLARFVAYGDWSLGYRLGVMDRYDETAFRLMEPFAEGIKATAAGFTEHPLPEEATACAAAALAMAGIAMSTSGETTPLSGFEHVISHALDFLRLTSGRELVFHGEQVALGSLVSARTIDWLLAQEKLHTGGWRDTDINKSLQILNDMIARAPIFGGTEPVPIPPEYPPQPQTLREKLETARQAFAEEYQKKSERWQGAAQKIASFAETWDETRRELARVTLRAPEMERLLKQAGLPCQPEETLPPTTEAEFRWAIRFSPFVRSRMNIGDLLFWMGKDPSFLLS